MRDALQDLCDLLEAGMETDAAVWRTQLPSTFENTAPAVVLVMPSDRHHQSRADRDIRFEVRCYGGSGDVTDAAAVYHDALDVLNNAHDSDFHIERIGELSGQEMPIEPDTGWPSYRITGRMRQTREEN
jgi:hypothetical protein